MAKARQAGEKDTADRSIPLAEDGAIKDHSAPHLRSSPIVPSTGIAGSSLTFVIAAMCFLACLFYATMISAQRTASQWSDIITSEVTVQILPDPAKNVDEQVAATLKVLGETNGITSAFEVTNTELSTMLEPWLGDSMDMSELPIPRMIMVTLNSASPPDLKTLSAAIEAAVPGAIFDDHRFWRDRLQTGAQSITIMGGLLFLLVLAVMVASVVFATRGAMSGNREVIEVLHFVGAPEPFIAAEFQRHFLVLGLRAGVIGGLMAMATLTLLAALLSRWIGNQQADEVRILLGDFGVDVATLAGIVVIVAMVAGLTALTTRATVFRYLHAVR